MQITGRGGIILINKAEVTAENPVEVLQEDFQKEKEDAEKEKDQIKNRISAMSNLIAHRRIRFDILVT